MSRCVFARLVPPVLLALAFTSTLSSLGCGSSSPAAPTPAAAPAAASPSVAPSGNAGNSGASSPTQPVVGTLSPPEIVQGADQQTITINGTNLQSNVSVTLKRPDGTTDTYGGSGQKIQNVSSTSLQIAPTFSTPGVYTLTITNGAGESSTPYTLTIESLTPVISGTSPRSPYQNTAAQNVLVVGSNFEAGLSVSLTAPDGSSSTITGAPIQNLTSTQFQMSVVLSQVGDYSFRVTNAYGKPSDPAKLTVQPLVVTAKPMITGLTPGSPTVSTSAQPIYLVGTGFATGASVALTPPSGPTTTFSGGDVTESGSTTIRIAPILATVGGYTLTVTNPNGDVSNVWSFTVQAVVVAKPVITGLSPSSPTASTASQPIYLAGTGFATGASVSLTAPSGQTTTFSGGDVTESGSTTIRIVPTLAIAGDYSVRVTNPNGDASNAWPFTVQAVVVAKPVITGLSPSSPTANTAAQPIYIGGTGFATGPTVTLTLPSGQTTTFAGGDVTQSGSTTVRIAPILATAGSYSVTVKNPNGDTSNVWTFTVQAVVVAKPVITGLSPSSPTANTAAQPIYIGGTGFATGPTVTLTLPSGQTTTFTGGDVTQSGSTTVRIAPILATAGSYSVSVKNPNGDTSNVWTFTVQAVVVAKPVITGLSPSSPTASTASQPIYIGGTGFATGPTVTLTLPSGQTTTLTGGDVTQSGSTTVRIAPTLSTAGAYSVQVTNPNGDASNVWSFTVQAAKPTITGVSPSSPTAGYNQPLSFSGTNFVSGLVVYLTSPSGTMVSYGASSVTSTSLQITAVIPDAGTWSVKVTNPSGQSSDAFTFKVVATSVKPQIDSVSPSSPTAGASAQPFYLLGSGFQAGLTVTLQMSGSPKMTFTGTAVNLKSDGTALSVMATFSTAGSYYAGVTNPNGDNSNVVLFTVKPSSASTATGR